jgi:cytoskeletal protein CcmA (bactofilin family)
MFLWKRSSPGASTPQGPQIVLPGGRSGTQPNQSVIGGSTRFRGRIHGNGPLTIRGQVEGRVDIDDRLIVAPAGRLEADARAGDILLEGSASGELLARGSLALRSTGRAEGRIQASRLRVERGGTMHGTVSRPRAES